MSQELLNVLVTVNLGDSIIDRLKTISPRLKFIRKVVKSASEISADQWKTIDILYTARILPEPNAAPRLRWIQTHMAGVDSLLTQPLLATAEDIILTNSSGIHAPKIAEYTLAMFLLFAQKIPAMMRAQAQSEWPDDRFERFMPRMLRDSTLGIVGYGSIGRETARLAHDFGMEVLATKRNVMRPQAVNEYVLPDTGDPEGIYVNRLYPPEALKSMLAASDFVQIAVPSVPATRKILGEAEFAAMRKHAVLVNVARGDVIDEAALIRALQTGQIGGAALDVFEIEPLPMTSPLWKMENVIISPHISGNTAHYNEDAAEVFAANLERYLVDEDLLNVINRTQGY